MKKYNYDWELELHKFSKLEKVKRNFDMTTKDAVMITLGAVVMAFIAYRGLYWTMAMIYAVTGVR